MLYRTRNSVPCFQVFNFVIAMAASMLVDVAGRRPLFLVSNAGMLISTTIAFVISGYYSPDWNYSFSCMFYHHSFLSERWKYLCSESNYTPYFLVLPLLQHCVYPHLGCIYPGDSTIPDSRERFRGYGEPFRCWCSSLCQGLTATLLEHYYSSHCGV